MCIVLQVLSHVDNRDHHCHTADCSIRGGSTPYSMHHAFGDFKTVTCDVHCSINYMKSVHFIYIQQYHYYCGILLNCIQNTSIEHSSLTQCDIRASTHHPIPHTEELPTCFSHSSLFCRSALRELTNFWASHRRQCFCRISTCNHCAY